MSSFDEPALRQGTGGARINSYDDDSVALARSPQRASMSATGGSSRATGVPSSATAFFRELLADERLAELDAAGRAADASALAQLLSPPTSADTAPVSPPISAGLSSTASGSSSSSDAQRTVDNKVTENS